MFLYEGSYFRLKGLEGGGGEGNYSVRGGGADMVIRLANRSTEIREGRGLGGKM
jgi:hypothetical protein